MDLSRLNYARPSSLPFYFEVTSSVDKRKAEKMVYLDTSKASDGLTQYLSSWSEEIWTALVN